MNLKLENFIYDLPEDRIAKYPSKNRSDSKLLFYDKGSISHCSFEAISELLPPRSLLVFNDTKVIPARIHLTKDTGARIEIFLLEPVTPSKVHEKVMHTFGSCTWKCMIGNAKKWKIQTQLNLVSLALKVTRINEDHVMFEWSTGMAFSDLLTGIGKIPLPPYINREPEEDDKDRYQTVYSKMEGAVAAPTAGLHFTDEIIDQIRAKGTVTDYVTLHVSAGTFQPIKVSNVSDHVMHNEHIWISQENIEHLLRHEQIIAAGTTTLRTLESLYWLGVKLKHGSKELYVAKKDAYAPQSISKIEALQAVLDHMKLSNTDRLGGQTGIFIYPGYEFRVCNGLVTNYHMPGSTLILLIAAFAGDDWKKIYEEALSKDYRFLSYGDSSLLLKK